MYTPTKSSSLGWSAMVPIVYPSHLWFIGVVSHSFYCVPQPTVVCYGGQPGLLMYTLANSGLLEWSAMAPNVYSSWLWFIRVVSQGSYCILQLTLVGWAGQPGFLLYTPSDSGLLGWSARAPIVYSSWPWFTVVVSQGSYCIPQPTLVRWGGQSWLLL